MPKIPSAAEFGPRVAPRASQGVTQFSGIPEDRTGRILSGLGDMVRKEVEELDALAAENALNKLREKRVDLTVGPGKGFQHVTGGAVIARPVLDEFPAEFGKVSSELAKGLSPGARARFQLAADREATGYKTDLLRHVAAQTEAFRSDVFKSTVAVEAAYASARWADPAAVTAALQRVEQATAAEVVRQGMEGDEAAKLRELFVKENSGAVITAAIKGALAGDNSAAAMGMFKQYEDKLTKQQREGLAPVLESATSWDKGQDLGQQAFAMQLSGKSHVQIEKFLQDSTKGSKGTYTNASTVWSQLQGARKAQQGEAADAAQALINQGQPWQKVRAQYLGSMDPSVVAAFDKRAETGAGAGKEVKTDFGVWYSVKEKIDSGEEVDLRQYVDRVSTSDLKTLATAQNKELKDLQTLTQQLSNAHKLMGLGSKKSDLERKGAFDAYVTDEIQQREATNKKRLTYDERKAIIEEAMEVTRDDWWRPTVRRYQTGPTEAPVTEGTPSEPEQHTPLARLLKEPSSEAKALGMTDAERAQIVTQYRSLKQGKLPSEDEIIRIYQRLKGG